ncbi:hypothetical protein ETD86_40830 [Nonomuraea turkmeniaca]|uniref:Uncharacterized protein n=1 Tax=Nonomuraea turkmeniaca TaxID=103838 RepID=A0A5S4F2T4_9ACTN|nr:hypothetical protein [Nonomuraea turkmeniaca]TMR10131.1 hypothetical protein ETD86_40830 [Nonomuraea turkmeniaca]
MKRWSRPASPSCRRAARSGQRFSGRSWERWAGSGGAHLRPRDEVLISRPAHPYTRALIACRNPL